VDQAGSRAASLFLESVEVFSRIAQAALWFTLWTFFTIATRKFHPTIVIAASATACLESASACAVYFDGLLLVPNLLLLRRFLSYATAIFLSVAVITVAVVLLIQLLYDILWGPDARRFGFWTNAEYDFCWIAVHVVLAACLRRVWRRWAATRKPEV